MRMLLVMLALLLAGCGTQRDGVTVTRSVSFGLYHKCLTAGIGLMLCDEIRFDPKDCALVIVYPKPPSKGALGALVNLSHQVRAACPEKEPTP